MFYKLADCYRIRKLPLNANQEEVKRAYFTVDFAKKKVLVVQGTPDKFSDTTFEYRYSKVVFRNCRVQSWNRFHANPLKTKYP